MAASKIPEELINKMVLMSYELEPHPLAVILKGYRDFLIRTQVEELCTDEEAKAIYSSSMTDEELLNYQVYGMEGHVIRNDLRECIGWFNEECI